MVNFYREAKIGMRSDAYNAYTKDIKNSKPLSPEDEYQLILRIKNGDEQARKELIEANTKYVIKVARDYATSDNLMDLIECGNYGMMIAIDTYNTNAVSTNGTPIKFITWASYFIKREIFSYIIHEGNMVHKSNEQKTFGKINKINDEFFQKEHRLPTADELMEALEEKDIHIKNAQDLYEVSYSSISSMSDDDDESSTFDKSKFFNDKTACENEYNAEVNADYNTMIVNRILSAFNEREQTIIKMLYGIGYEREYSIVEIADLLELSAERVRQIKDSSLKKMKKVAAVVMKQAI